MQAAYSLAEVLMLHDQRNLTAGMATLTDLHYRRDVLPCDGFSMHPPLSKRQA